MMTAREGRADLLCLGTPGPEQKQMGTHFAIIKIPQSRALAGLELINQGKYKRLAQSENAQGTAHGPHSVRVLTLYPQRELRP